MSNYEFKTSEQTWDTIAKSFDKTRKKPWVQCMDFINKLSYKFTVGDIGCGNGRHLILCAKQCKEALGIDLSYNLLRIVKTKLIENNLRNVFLIHSNMVELPLKDDILDAVLCIAAIHNIKGRNQRIQSLKEINRILKKGGIGLISVWSRWQEKFRKHFIKKNKNDIQEFGDIEIFWKQDNLNVPRFYHLYSKIEFKQDLLQAGFRIIEIKGVRFNSTLAPDNFFAIVRKE